MIFKCTEGAGVGDYSSGGGGGGGEKNRGTVKHYCSSRSRRLRVVSHFSSGIVERGKSERAFSRDLFHSLALRLLAWGDFHARSRFARSTIPEEKWGTTRSLAFMGRGVPATQALDWSLDNLG